MSNLLHALFLGGYTFLILPAVILMVVSFFDRSKNNEYPSRRRLLIFLTLTILMQAFLGLLIWFNPYGRELNSSLPAFGVLVILVALLAYLLHNIRGFAGLWGRDKVLLIAFVVTFLGLFGFLWLGDPAAMYTVLIVTPLVVLAWALPRTGFVSLSILSLIALSVLLLTGGGWIFVHGADMPVWSRTALAILMSAGMMFSILLPAGLWYAVLRPSGAPTRSRWLWSLILTVLLLAGVAYQVAWDGIWSSAHARAFEDHLPFIHFMLSLIGGVLLTLTLRGWRRWAGPLYVTLVTAVTVTALASGWDVSAFEMTEQRAEKVNHALVAYYEENGTYPASLGELRPDYLLFVPPPVVVRTGGWCYQSTGDAYRLGYISGDFTYFERNFRIVTHAQAGGLAEDLGCDELRAKLQAGELAY